MNTMKMKDAMKGWRKVSEDRMKFEVPGTLILLTVTRQPNNEYIAEAFLGGMAIVCDTWPTSDEAMYHAGAATLEWLIDNTNQLAKAIL